jgi:hypothetical protein
MTAMKVKHCDPSILDVLQTSHAKEYTFFIKRNQVLTLLFQKNLARASQGERLVRVSKFCDVATRLFPAARTRHSFHREDGAASARTQALP